MGSPAFQFYPADYLGSQRVSLMSLEEEGAYIRLICSCWKHGSIPANPEQIARLIGKGADTTLATTLATMFQPHPENPMLLIHERLEQERAKQMEWRRKSAEGGKKSAEKRQNLKGGSTTLQPPLEGWLPNGSNQNPTLHLQSSSSNKRISIEDATAWAKESKLGEEHVAEWHSHRESQNWEKSSGVPITNWRADLTTWVHRASRETRSRSIKSNKPSEKSKYAFDF